MVTYAGWSLSCQYRTSSADTYRTLNGIQRITYSLVEGVEVKEECGTRYPTLVEGIYGLSGTIERFYTGSGVWASLFVKGEAALDYCDIKIFPAGNSSGNPVITLSGIKFNSTNPTHRPAANLMLESWSFLGTGSVATGTV